MVFRRFFLPWFLGAILTSLFYLPSLTEGFFPTDDATTLGAVQVRTASWASLVSTITPGNNTDYAPVRDLTYMLDWLWGQNLEVMAAPARLQNWFWFFLTGALFFALLSRVAPPAFVIPIFLIWFLSGAHGEMLFWLTARKDILALFFGVLAVLMLIRAADKGTRGFAVAAIAAFVASLLSKSSLILLPPAASIYLLCFDRPLLKKKPLIATTLMSAVLISIPILVLQAGIFSTTNPMSYDYTLDYRIFASLAGLGRMMTGLIFFGVNTVEIANGGEWAQINRAFVLPGALTVIVFVALLIRGMRARDRLLLLLLILGLSAYVIIPGPNFKHRNFYSIRYFEPLFMILVSLGAHLVPRIRKAQIVLWSLAVVSIAATWKDSQHWESTEAIAEKAFSFQPENPALQEQFVIALGNRFLNGHMQDPAEQRVLRETLIRLDKECRIGPDTDVRNSHLCLHFWKNAAEYARLAHGLGVTLTPRTSEVIAAVESITQHRGLGDRERKLFSAFSDQVFSRDVLLKGFVDHATFPTTMQRAQKLFFNCYRNDGEEARNVRDEYLRKVLLTKSLVTEFIREIRDPQEQAQVIACLEPLK